MNQMKPAIQHIADKMNDKSLDTNDDKPAILTAIKAHEQVLEAQRAKILKEEPQPKETKVVSAEDIKEAMNREIGE